MVGSLSGIGGSPALCRFKVPGAWYDTTGSVHLVRVGPASSPPEKWRTVEVYCETGELTVTPTGGEGTTVLVAGEGLRYHVRSDGSHSPPERLDHLPDDVIDAIEAGAYDWQPVNGGAGLAVSAVSPGDGRIGFSDAVGDPVNLLTLVEDDLQALNLAPEAVPYHVGMRMTSGVATNEGAMFAAIDASGLEATAEPGSWMLDVAPGDTADLFLRVPRGLANEGNA
jgi:hypothetical protein